MGHRLYVGGADADTWYGIGLLQYHFLVSQGLKPHHRFLDIACGSLRLGQYLIPFLEDARYFGLEAEKTLVEAGLMHELGFDLADQKNPTFGFGYDFDFSFVPEFDFAIAQSLLTHLTTKDIQSCLSSLRLIANKSARLYFTFFEGDSRKNPTGPSHANHCWFYSFEELQNLASQTNWQLSYIGEWNHPRNQMMILARPA